MAKHTPSSKNDAGIKIKLGSKPVMTPAAGLRTAKGKLAGIDLDDAFELMISDEQSFFGHKEIVFSGICAWTKRSRTMGPAKKAIAKATAGQIAIAEAQMTQWFQLQGRHRKPTRKRALEAASLGQMLASSSPEYRPLYLQVYLRIGGMKGITDAFKRPAKHHTTKQEKKRLRPKRELGIRHLVTLAAVLDYHARQLSSDPKRYGKPRLLKKMPLTRRLTKTGNSAGDAETIWLVRSGINELLAEHRSAFALLYGAACVRLPENNSLLDRLLTKKPRSEEITPYIGEWLAYAKHFAETVLSQMRGGWKEVYTPSIAGIQAREPTPLPLSETHIAQIKAAFAHKAEFGTARLQFKLN